MPLTSVQYHISPGVPVFPFNNDAVAAPVVSKAYAFPPGRGVKNLSWKTAFVSAPGSCSIVLEGSIDDITWYTLDTSTATAGETRALLSELTGSMLAATRFIRVNKSAQTGGGALTVTLALTTFIR